MSGPAFYLVKALAIISVTLAFFIVLAAGSFALSKIFPDDAQESIETTFLTFMGQIGAFVLLFYVVRAQLKKIPQIFEGIQGFESERLKEKDGQIISGLALLMFSDSFLSRGMKIKDWIQKKYA